MFHFALAFFSTVFLKDNFVLGVPSLSVSGDIPSQSPQSLRISVDFHKADIHDVIQFFAKTTGFNFVVSDGVSGSVTARLIDVPWQDALHAILASKGLAAQNMGSLILVK